jgi:hypothetical protein
VLSILLQVARGGPLHGRCSVARFRFNRTTVRTVGLFEVGAIIVLVLAFLSVSSPSFSAGHPIHRADQVLIRGVRVDRRSQDRLVPGKALGEPNILGPSVDGRAGQVAQNVEAHVAVESRASLPHSEPVAYLLRRMLNFRSRDAAWTVAMTSRTGRVPLCENSCDN